LDRRLVARAKDGDRVAFERLASEISDGLYQAALRILRDREAAGDALQAGLVRIWRDLPSLRDPERFEPWAHRVLVHCCYAQLRSERRQGWARVTPTDAIVDDTQLATSDRDELERAFVRLTPEQRAAIALIYYRDLTITEAAEWLGIAEGTLKSRLHYARRSLRAALEADTRPVFPEERTA
jgi:RNA polymerase sigma-70 factor (ECF subfamily)